MSIGSRWMCTRRLRDESSRVAMPKENGLFEGIVHKTTATLSLPYSRVLLPYCIAIDETCQLFHDPSSYEISEAVRISMACRISNSFTTQLWLFCSSSLRGLYWGHVHFMIVLFTTVCMDFTVWDFFKVLAALRRWLVPSRSRVPSAPQLSFFHEAAIEAALMVTSNGSQHDQSKPGWGNQTWRRGCYSSLNPFGPPEQFGEGSQEILRTPCSSSVRDCQTKNPPRTGRYQKPRTSRRRW